MEILKVIEGNIADILSSSPTHENILIIVKADDLKEFANTLIQQAAIASEKCTPQKDKIEQPISQAEAEKFLGVTRQFMYNQRRNGRFKAYKLGGKVMYYKSELIEAMRNDRFAEMRDKMHNH